MSSRIATGPIGVSDSIRARIRTDPSLLEEGLRLLDHDVQAGEAGPVDAIAVDRAGRLVIVSIAPADIDHAIARILDLKAWSTDQRDLLGRLYASHGVAIDRPVRILLLAPALPHALLRRLALLPIDVTLLLARPVVFEDGTRIAIEAAASVLGLEADAAPPARTWPAAQTGRGTSAGTAASALGKPNGRDSQSAAASATPFWPDEVLPPEHGDEEYGDEKTVPLPPAMEAEADDPAWPGSPDDRFPWELPGDPLSSPDEPMAPPEAPEPVFETLTAEEMQEFARFDKQRRERDGRSS